jgi:hypothetical protein
MSFVERENLVLHKVAIIGGSSRDPEALALKEISPSIKFEYFGIENLYNDENFTFLDLNQEIEMIDPGFDLVLCSQVLEHLWNVSSAFITLSRLAGKSGYLWINCPASNMAHGSPAYYSAGYSPEYLQKNLEALGHQVIVAECVGSKRNYFFTHILRHWASERDHHDPIRSFRAQRGTFQGKVRQYLEVLPKRFLTLFFSSEITYSIDFATESYSLSKLRE